jgi:predicted translation initiation factor SUI1
MAKREKKTALFLCAGDDPRGQAAATLFDSVAGKIGMAWQTSVRDLMLGQPDTLTSADLEAAGWVVALDEAEHLPLLEAAFPGWAEKVESWQVKDAAAIEREVMDLTARLIGGGRKRVPIAPEAVEEAPAPREKAKPAVVRVGRETKGRRGKGVTTVSDVPLDEAGLTELAARLKQRCGTGGTVKDGRIEIQGDQRDRLAVELEALGYRVKRAGGSA